MLAPVFYLSQRIADAGFRRQSRQEFFAALR